MTPTQVTIRRVLALAAPFFCAGVLAPSIAAAAEPVPFATATAPCGEVGEAHLTFPVQQSSHPNVIFHFKSIGGSGDSGWWEFPVHNGEVEAGIAPTFFFNCGPGSVEASLADRPSTPATFSGVTTPEHRSSLPFMAPGAGQYIISLVISQGAIRIGDVPGILESSGEYPLGPLSAGDQELGVRAESGPTAIWSATVRELPVVINKLKFGQACMTPGTGLPATFSVTGDTSITATVRDASGGLVRSLGTFNVKEGNRSIPWDGRDTSGGPVPNGSYVLDLTSTDPQGDSTSAHTPIKVASSGPRFVMISRRKITPRHAVVLDVSDDPCGLSSASVEIDGRSLGTYRGRAISKNGVLLISPGKKWTLGFHRWKIKAKDKVGNVRVSVGSFVVRKSLGRAHRRQA